MKAYHDYEYDSRMHDFEKKLNITGKIIRRTLKLLAYIPFLLAGYIIVEKFLELKTVQSISRLLIATLAAVFIDITIILLKHWMLSLKEKRNLFWLLLFMLCFCFTSVLTVVILIKPVSELLSFFFAGENPIIAWSITVAFGLLVFSRYHFFSKSYQQLI